MDRPVPGPQEEQIKRAYFLPLRQRLSTCASSASSEDNRQHLETSWLSLLADGWVWGCRRPGDAEYSTMHRTASPNTRHPHLLTPPPRAAAFLRVLELEEEDGSIRAFPLREERNAIILSVMFIPPAALDVPVAAPSEEDWGRASYQKRPGGWRHPYASTRPQLETPRHRCLGRGLGNRKEGAWRSFLGSRGRPCANAAERLCGKDRASTATLLDFPGQQLQPGIA